MNRLNRKPYVRQTKQPIECRFMQHAKADSPLELRARQLVVIHKQKKNRREELNMTQDALTKKVGYKSRTSIYKMPMKHFSRLRAVETDLPAMA